MASGLTYLCAMARSNALSNNRLLHACSRLAPAELDAGRDAFFGTIARTLNHILVVDWYYLDALEGGGLGPSVFIDEHPCATMRDLVIEQRKADQRLIGYCESLTEERLAHAVKIVRGTGQVLLDQPDRVLLHLFSHQIHHRGQVHGMLSGTASAPPQLDEFLMAGDAPNRAPDLAEIGWTEGQLWPE